MEEGEEGESSREFGTASICLLTLALHIWLGLGISLSVLYTAQLSSAQLSGLRT